MKMFLAWLRILVILAVGQSAVEAFKFDIGFRCRVRAKITNGDVRQRFDNSRDLYEIRKGDFTCKPGYEMNIKKPKKISFECTNGTWQGYFDDYTRLEGFGLKDVRCKEKHSMCSKPKLINHGRYYVKSRFCKSIKKVSSCVGRFFTGDEVKYRCKLGYQMRQVKVEKPEEEEAIRVGYDYYDYYMDEDSEAPEEFEPQVSNFTCDDKGAWTNGQNDEFPICDKIICNGSRFENISNGYVKNFTDIYNYGQLEFGDVLELVCDRGYKPINNNRHLECYDTEKFGEAEFGCERIRCPRITDPIGGRAYLANGTRYVDDIVYFHCNEYKAKLIGPKEMTCLENGEWSSDRCVRCFPKDADCPPPCMHENNLLKTANPNFKHGTVIQLTCSNDQDITHNRTCLLNNLWDKTDLYCTGKTDSTKILSTADSLKKAMRSFSERKNDTEEEVFEGKSIREGEMPGGVEIYFALDVSGSISFDEFALLKNITLELIKQLNISNDPDGTRLCFYVFASKTGLLYDGHWTKPENVLLSTEEALKTVDRLLNQSTIREKMFEKDLEEFVVGQGTNIKALMDELIDTDGTKRHVQIYQERPAQQVAIVISDGEFNTAGNPKEQAQELKDLGVEIYSIYVGKNSPNARLGMEVMKSLNSSIENEIHYFEIANEDMSEVFGQMINRTIKTCGSVDENKRHFATENTAKKEPADQHAWPWMVQFKDTRCGGSLIDRKHILTAAHCFLPDAISPILSEYTFFLKSHKLLYKEEAPPQVLSMTVKKENIKVHEKYDFSTTPRYLYDIALVTLPKEVQYDFGITLRPICLPENQEIFDEVDDDVIPGIAIGWGMLRKNKDPDVLHQVQMTIPDQRTCTQNVAKDNKAKFNRTLMFCAGGKDGKTQVDTCSGDSGGPFVIRDPGNEDRYIQIGIVSSGFTDECFKEEQYGLYTKLNDELLQWIKDTIKDEEDKVE